MKLVIIWRLHFKLRSIIMLIRKSLRRPIVAQSRRQLSVLPKAGISAKRFYNEVGVRKVSRDEIGYSPPCEAHQFHGITLDGRLLKTPAKQTLALPNESLAWMIALEWDAQAKDIRPHSMPMMKLATIAIDQIPSIKSQILDGLRRNLESDTVCFRSELLADQAQLAALEKTHWDPLLGTLESEMGIRLNTTTGFTLQQPEGSVDNAMGLIEFKNPFALAAMDSLAMASKSCVIPLVMSHGSLDAKGACKAIRLVEDWQTAEWGYVEGGHDLDEIQLYVQVAAASLVLQLLP